MPFTLAHPAIIIPLRKSKKFSLTALIVGSMVPDFEFFLQLREVKKIGHHWYGIFLFDFPLALVVCFLFHNMLKNLLVSNLPFYLKNRIGDVSNFNWNSYAQTNKWGIVISLFIGICSHILWDGFTHYDGLFVNMLPILKETINIVGLDFQIYYLLQLVFSIIGMLILFSLIQSIPPNSIIFNENKSNLYWPFFLVTLSIILIIRLTGWSEFNSFWSVFMAVMGGICYSWILISILFKYTLINKKSA